MFVTCTYVQITSQNSPVVDNQLLTSSEEFNKSKSQIKSLTEQGFFGNKGPADF